MKNKELVKILKRFPKNADIIVRPQVTAESLSEITINASQDKYGNWKIILIIEKISQNNEKNPCQNEKS